MVKLKLQELTQMHSEAIVSLYQRTQDYFMLAEGEVPESCEELLFDTPPNVSLEKKIVLGAMREHQLVGLVDCVYGFPQADTSMIGLLLVDSACRGKKIGTQLFEHIVELSKEQGMSRIRIGVMDTNEKALKFWSALGFVHLETKGPVTYGDRTHMIRVMIYDFDKSRR